MLICNILQDLRYDLRYVLFYPLHSLLNFYSTAL